MATRNTITLLIGASLALAAVGCEAEALCTNSCQWANDGECDDGGEGALYRVCSLGTDCGDCGVRAADGTTLEGATCVNTCEWANDGECDDGGAGSDYDVCAFGTDCGDCGVRRPGDEADAGGDEEGPTSSSGGGSWDSGYEYCDLGDPLAICLCMNPGNYSICWDI